MILIIFKIKIAYYLIAYYLRFLSNFRSNFPLEELERNPILLIQIKNFYKFLNIDQNITKHNFFLLLKELERNLLFLIQTKSYYKFLNINNKT